MKRLTIILITFFAAAAAGSAQTRTYSDNAAGTFVFGLESYFYGESGSLDFEAEGTTFRASIGADGVFVGEQQLSASAGDVVIGIHDFTGNKVPEFVMAVRAEGRIGVSVYSLETGRWTLLKTMTVRSAKEVRVFRQVLSMRQGDVLSSWTWHGGRFDYKASDGSAEPTFQ